MSARTTRALLTVAGTVLAVLTVLTVVLVGAGPAAAASQDAGSDPNAGIGLVAALLLFVLVPLALLVGIGGLAWVTGGGRGSRYRPTRGWTAAPLWFAGPPDPAAALASAPADDLVRGGARGSW